MITNATVIKYGDNVDTDVIIPARYLNSSDPKELAAHCMEDIDSTFVSRVQAGDVIVGGNNFGCGSSREHAPLAIKTSGIACVVAKSFARIFYRNSINIGLPIIECDADIDEGDKVSIDFEKGEIANLTKGTTVTFKPFPAFLQGIVAAGGLLKSLAKSS
ncbi:MAG: 3-isopropylmalate dehydratase small subunit [Acetanaerobacterium sp.]